MQNVINAAKIMQKICVNYAQFAGKYAQYAEKYATYMQKNS